MTSHSRRTVLRTAGVVTAAAATTASALAWGSTGSAPGRPVFVLVPTSSAGGSWFTPLVTELGLRGHRAVAVDLPGHGPDAFYPVAYQAQNLDALATEPSPAAALTLADYVDHVVGVVRRAHEHGPVVLAAHGDGGATLNLVANAVPELLARLVYLGAACCTDLPTLGDYFAAPENADAVPVPTVGNPAELGVTRINWRSGDPDTLAAFRAALAEDHTDARFRAVLNSLQPDEPAALWGTDARGNPATWGRIPRTYVRFAADRTMRPALQDRMIREADAATPDNPFAVETVAAPHAGPLHRPDIVSILSAVDQR
jgi:pimeloyl-ACP methyl ester carboxylesterase